MTDRSAGRSRSTAVGVLALLAVLAVGVTAYLVSRKSPPPAGASTDSGAPVSAPSVRDSTKARIRVAAVGDSITVGNSADVSGRLLADLSWAYYLPETVEFVGGWARAGATTAEMAAAATAVPADVLVILAGTNDLGRVPFESSAASLVKIAQKVGAAKVVVSSIPPLDQAPELAVAYNQHLAALASEQGWTFADGAAPLRTVDSRFKPGLGSDGVHPTESGAKILGQSIGAAVVAAVADR